MDKCSIYTVKTDECTACSLFDAMALIGEKLSKGWTVETVGNRIDVHFLLVNKKGKHKLSISVDTHVYS